MNKNIWKTKLFFGALWGIIEATLGYALQFLPPWVSGSVMFPIASALMIYVYLQTKSKSSVLMLGVIAASIKSINFFMPGLLPIKTYNPMISIMLQSMVMVGVTYVIDKQKVSLTLVSVALASFLWRAFFFANIQINHAITGFKFPQMKSSAATIEFLFTFGMIGAIFSILTYGIIVLLKMNFKLNFQPKMYVSLATFILAIVLTYYIQFI